MAVKSARRHEYPHSLSYHAPICTRSPFAPVRLASMIELYGERLKSLDTSSASLKCTYFLSSPDAARLRISLSSSLVVSFLTCATRYTIETVGVGTRSAKPSNVPLTSGIVRYSAFAAPVEVGMMLVAALR